MVIALNALCGLMGLLDSNAIPGLVRLNALPGLIEMNAVSPLIRLNAGPGLIDSKGEPAWIGSNAVTALKDLLPYLICLYFFLLFGKMLRQGSTSLLQIFLKRLYLFKTSSSADQST